MWSKLFNLSAPEGISNLNLLSHSKDNSKTPSASETQEKNETEVSQVPALPNEIWGIIIYWTLRTALNGSLQEYAYQHPFWPYPRDRELKDGREDFKAQLFKYRVLSKNFFAMVNRLFYTSYNKPVQRAELISPLAQGDELISLLIRSLNLYLFDPVVDSPKNILESTSPEFNKLKQQEPKFVDTKSTFLRFYTVSEPITIADMTFKNIKKTLNKQEVLLLFVSQKNATDYSSKKATMTLVNTGYDGIANYNSTPTAIGAIVPIILKRLPNLYGLVKRETVGDKIDDTKSYTFFKIKKSENNPSMKLETSNATLPGGYKITKSFF